MMSIPNTTKIFCGHCSNGPTTEEEFGPALGYVGRLPLAVAAAAFTLGFVKRSYEAGTTPATPAAGVTGSDLDAAPWTTAANGNHFVGLSCSF